MQAIEDQMGRCASIGYMPYLRDALSPESACVIVGGTLRRDLPSGLVMGSVGQAGVRFPRSIARRAFLAAR